MLLVLPFVACAPPARPDIDERASRGRAGAAIPGNRAGTMQERPRGVAALTASRWEAPHRGGAGELSFSVECEPGWVAVGLHGRAGDHIDRVGLVCQRLGAGGALEGEDFRRTHGGEAGQSFLQMCPAGYAIGGLGGRVDARLMQLQIVCDSLSGAMLFYGRPAGGPGSSLFTDIAPHRYFLTKLTGHGGDRVNGLRAVYNRVAL